MIADAIGMKNAEGALVARLEPDSPAAKGGVEIGDVITSVFNEAVKDTRDLSRRIAATAPGTATKLGVFRNGHEKTITVTVGKFPRTSADAKAEKKVMPSETPVLGTHARAGKGRCGS